MKKEVMSYENVWDALEDTPEQAANMNLRSELMFQIEFYIKRQGWKQAEAASRCGVTQPRINDLLHGRIHQFSLDALVNMVTRLGREVRVEVVEPVQDDYHKGGSAKLAKRHPMP